jgi:hypothetical protein
MLYWLWPNNPTARFQAISTPSHPGTSARESPNRLWVSAKSHPRLNLDIRQHVVAVGRRVHTVCKHDAGLRQQLALFHVCHHFCLPHSSLRLPLPQPEPTNGTGLAKLSRPCTPAMAAGLTDRVRTLREGLRFRVPPRPQPL